MKDLHINQKSIINGVKRLPGGLCRVSSKVKNTNHILIKSEVKYIDNAYFAQVSSVDMFGW